MIVETRELRERQEMELRASVSWSITGAIIIENYIVSEFLEAQFQMENSIVFCQDKRKWNEGNKRRDMSAFCPISCTRLYGKIVMFYDYETKRNYFGKLIRCFDCFVLTECPRVLKQGN